ncbi:MAG: DUF4097 family beta strand repeat protein [Epulopiscium sp.]|nr:DUF4097 family beta strand repeat protein [Candidatus Epulonipiscium sp.]
MNEEKMTILKMLEQGKITAAEASELLNALKNKDDKKQETKTPTANNQWENSKSSDSFSRDLGKKIEVLSKDLEPKLQKITQTLIDKTNYIADKISKSFSDSYGGEKEKTLELYVGNKKNAQLKFNGKNGVVYIKGYNGDKITAKVKYITKNEGNNIELLELGDTFYLNYNEAYFSKVSIEAYVPEELFKNLYVNSVNGNICIDGFKAEEIHLETTNGKITLGNITGQYVEADTSNATIEVKQYDIVKTKLLTTNSNIFIGPGIVEPEKSDIYELRAETSNGKIEIELSKDIRIGYSLEANTSLNGIQVDIPTLEYEENEKNYVKGKTQNYTLATRKVKLDLEASNAPIIIK